MRKDTKKHTYTLIGILIMLGLAIWIDGPWHPSINWGSFQRDLNIKLGLDLQGGSHLVYLAKIDENNKDQAVDALAGVRDVIEKRVNSFGVSEPIVQTNKVGDEYRVIIELAGVTDPQEAIRRIGETPQLDFRKEIEKDAVNPENIDGVQEIVAPTFEKTDLSGKNLKRATVSFDQISGTPEVNLEFDSEGTKLFADITKENIGHRIAIYLDGVPIEAPVVQSEITNGKAVISGGFNIDQAKQLASRLNAGALPIPIELISQQTVGPTLGKISINQSIKGGIIGLLGVIIWMTVFYRLPGLVASAALLMYALFFLAIMKLLPITLTLAGIAGFILSIGMAVDANVLIFERMREHIRSGKNVQYALEDGFREAWGAINAANVSSIITGVVLYFLGTSIIRGFAVTFSIGIILSVFTAVTVTKTILTLVLYWKKTHTPALLAATQVNKPV